MFAYIKGKLIEATPSNAIIESHGIGYRIYIPANLFSKLPQINEEALLYTSYVVRELSQTLYGFLSNQERDLFDLLMTVSGIGPKLALSVIGHINFTELQKAISNHDVSAISKVPGIGKKTAEKLIIELRDKISQFLPTMANYSLNISDDPRGQMIRDAMNALVNLGYNQGTAQKAIKKSLEDESENMQLTTLITAALKHIRS